MNTLYIDEREIYLKNKYPLVNASETGEGDIREYDKNNVMKILFSNTQNQMANLSNKQKKIEILGSVSQKKGITIPKKVILGKQSDRFIGYTMKHIYLDNENYNTCLDFSELKTSILSDKILYLKKLYKMMLTMINHYKKYGINVVYVDFRGNNFIIDKDENVWIIDLDNMYVNEYKADVRVGQLGNYMRNVSKEIDFNTWQYLMGVFILETLNRDDDILSADTIFKDNNILKDYVNNLDINSNARDFFLELFYGNGNLNEIDSVLNSLNDDERMDLKMKNPRLTFKPRIISTETFKNIYRPSA